jgi:hypothetical protein
VAHGTLSAAETVLTLTAAGVTVPGSTLLALIGAELPPELAPLAQAVLAAGPHALRRAVDLAIAVRRAAETYERAERARKGTA